jgi:MFS family permease
MLISDVTSMTSRRMLAPRAAYALAALIVGLALFASGVPSALYGIYRELWGFSALVLTLVYAIYAFGVLTTLILAGRLSDDVGRRPVLVVALGVLMGSTALFIAADSVVWLFVARAIQGLATGAILSAGSAALLDLHPRRDPVSVSLANGSPARAGWASASSSRPHWSSWRPRRAFYRSSCWSRCSRSRSSALRGCPSRSSHAHARD